MITAAYSGFGVSVREYHIPYVENRDDIRVKYVYRREEDIPQFAEYEPLLPGDYFHHGSAAGAGGRGSESGGG